LVITLKHIEVYKKCGGDADCYQRMKPKEISDEVWVLLDGFMQDLFLVRKGLSSAAFSSEVMQRLKCNSLDQETAKAVQQLEIDLER
jgi:hypothetical protein